MHLRLESTINVKTLTIEKGFYWILTLLFVINISFLANAYFSLNYLLAYLFIFFLIRICILLSLKKLPSKKKPSDFFKYYLYEFISFIKRQSNKIRILNSFKHCIHVFKSSLTNNNFLLIKQLLFDFCIGLSILISIMGDAEKPLLYFLIVFLFYLIINTNIINIKRTCYLTLGVLFIINISSLAKVAIFKFYKEGQLISNQSKDQRYKIQNIKTKTKSYSFIVKNDKNMGKILNELKIYPDKDKDIFKGIVYNLNSLQSLDKIPRNNVYYVNLLNDILLKFPNELDKNNKVLILEFINPLPILLDLKPIKGAYHWFHLGYTFSNETIHRFNETFERSDFVYMPLLSLQNVLKCYFYKWNFQYKRFALSSIHKYGFLFTTPQKIKEYNLEKLEFPNPDKIKESCLSIESEQIEREKNQPKNILTRLLQRLNL